MRRWLKRILIVLAVFVLPPVAFYFYANWQGERELRAAIAELDAQGEPWRWEDLMAAQPELADEDDVHGLIASVHRQTKNKFDKVYNETLLYLPPNVLMSEHDLEIYRATIPAAEIPLAEARKLADMPRGRIRAPSPWFVESYSVASERNIEVVGTVRLGLQFSAAWHAHLGDLDTALVDCLAMLRVSYALQDELTLWAHQVRLYVQSTATSSVQRILAHGEPPPARLRQIQEALEQFDSQRAILNGYRGERAGVGPGYAWIAEGKLKAIDFEPWREKRTWIEESITEAYYRANVKQAHAWSLRHLTAALNALELSEPERSARWRELEKEERQAPRAARLPHHELLRGTFQAYLRTEAQARCAIAGLAAESFRQDHDRWPHALVELSPKYLVKVPDDSCTGQPLQLRATNDGIVIYSVGPDCQHSGNYQEQLAAKQGPFVSYEFRLWNVPQRRLVSITKP